MSSLKAITKQIEKLRNLQKSMWSIINKEEKKKSIALKIHLRYQLKTSTATFQQLEKKTVQNSKKNRSVLVSFLIQIKIKS